MLKSNLEILEYVHSCPNHSVDADTLAAFIGDSAERRLSDLFHDSLLARSSNWYSDGPVVYSLSGKGFDLLARNEQERQRRADDEARDERHRLEAEAQAARNRRNVLVSAILGAIVGAVAALVLQKLFG